MSDLIEVRSLRVLGVHGVNPAEQDQPQPFEVDLVVEADLGPAAREDDLSATVDYGRLVERARRIVAEEHHQLLESLAGSIATSLLAEAGVGTVTVVLRKLRPPLPADVGSVGVRITRRRLGDRAGGPVAEPGRVRRAYLGLGSNLGDREGHLARALSGLRGIDPDLACSPVYETEPVGGPEGQGRYLNCVVRVETALGARDLLALAQRLERAAGRMRSVRFGPRTLDVDVLLVGDEEIGDVDLVVPHPRMFERAFVLAPLEDLDPSLVPAGWRSSFGGAAGVAAAVRRVGPAPGPARPPIG